LIHTYPVGEDSLVSDRSKKEVSAEVLEEKFHCALLLMTVEKD
jgi:hypothetical protein